MPILLGLKGLNYSVVLMTAAAEVLFTFSKSHSEYKKEFLSMKICKYSTFLYNIYLANFLELNSTLICVLRSQNVLL